MRVKIYGKAKKKKLYYGGTDVEYDPVTGLPIQNTNQTVPTTQPTTQSNFNYDAVQGIAGLGQVGGQFISALGERKDGKVNVGAKVAGGALSGAATGAALGTSIMPGIGTAIGAIGGALVGGITSGTTAGKQNKAIMDAEKAQKQREADMNEERSRYILNNFPTQGVKNAQYYYAAGGVLPLQGMPPQGMPQQGGILQPVNSDTTVAQGATHEQGGIDIGTAEVEDNEVLVEQSDGSNKVFSDRLPYKNGTTFAQEAARLSEEKAKEEAKMTSNSIYEKGTATRNIEKLNQQLDDLFAVQEARKQELGLQNPQGEAGFGDVVGSIMPYVDNVTNAILTAKTPQIPDPIYDKAMPLKTEYNINPQLAATVSQTNQLARNLAQNTSNSTTLRNNIIAANAANIGNINQLYGTKENIETQLKNQDALNRQQVQMGNVAKENQYNLNKMHRIDDIHQRISANVADAAVNAQQQRAEANLKRRDLLELEIIKKQYEDSGVWDRNLQGLFDSYAKGDTSYEEFAAALQEKAKAKKASKEASKKYSKSKNTTNDKSYLGKVAPKYGNYFGNNNVPVFGMPPYSGVYQIPQKPR
jgi:hypothetical protein